MNNKRFWAALLTATMILTSQSYSVSAFTQDNLSDYEDAEISVMSEEVDSVLDKEEPLTDELSDTSEEVLQEGMEVPDNNEIVTVGQPVEVSADEDAKLLPATEEDYEAPEGASSASDFLIAYDIGGGQKVLSINSTKGQSIDACVGSDGYVAIPSGVTIIPEDTKLFKGATKVHIVDFETGRDSSKSLTICENAFEGCTGLTTFYAPDDYKTVSANTFKNCRNLETVDFGNVETIGSHAFDGCLKFGKGTISRGTKINEIGSYAFSATGFSTLDFDKMGSEAASIILGEYAFSSCTDLVSISIPNTIEKVPAHCFENCTSLTTIGINAKSPVVGEIGDHAFAGCTSLKSVGSFTKVMDDKDKTKIKEVKDITDTLNVKYLGAYAFEGCTRLEKIVLPRSVSKIGTYAFSGCNALVDVLIENCNADTGEADIDIDQYAFPMPIYGQATIYGHDGTVKEFAEAETHKFKLFFSLVPAYTYAANTANGRILRNFNVSPASGKAKPGTEVTIRVSSKTEGGYTFRLRRNDLNDINGGLKKKDFVFVKGDENSQTFKFIMPHKDVLIDFDKGVYYDDWLKNAALTHTIEEYDGSGLKYKWVNDQYEVDKTGEKGLIGIDATAIVKSKEEQIMTGCWMYEYTSSDPTIASVDASGIITSRGMGYATITAAYKPNKSIKQTFTVHVGQEAVIDYLHLKSEDRRYVSNTPATRKFNEVTYNDIEVMEIPRNTISNTPKTFTLLLEAKESQTATASQYVNAVWSSSNTSFATVKEAKNDTNKNVITVKNGICGEACIKVAYDTKRKDADGINIVRYAYYIIRVVDMNPRVTAGDIIVNTNFDMNTADEKGGTPIEIIPYGDKSIDPSTLSIKRGNGETSLGTYTELKLVSDGDNNYRLLINQKSIKEGTSRTYSGNNRLFITGNYTDTNKTPFASPFDKVIVTNSPLKFNAGKNGAINLYYNSQCYNPLNVEGHLQELPKKNDDEKDEDYVERYINATVGLVKMPNNIAPAEAEVLTAGDYTAQLWDVTTYNKWQANKNTKGKERIKNSDLVSAAPGGYSDKLTNNFNIIYDGNDNQFVILRSGNPLAMEMKNGKKVPITSGYLAVYFKGYSLPSIQKINIATSNKAPSYRLKQASTMENTRNNSAIFRISVINPKTKEVVLSQNSIASANIVPVNNQPLDFKDLRIDGEDIVFTAKEGLKSGAKTAAVSVTRKNWDASYLAEYPVIYKYNVTYNDKSPTAKLTASTVKFNKWYYASSGGKEVTDIVLNQPNCKLTLLKNAANEEFIYVGNYPTEAAKLKISAVSDPNYPAKLGVRVQVLNDTIQKGKYKFEFTPRFTWNAGVGSTESLKKMVMTVDIIDKKPVIKLSNSTFIYNTAFPGLENKRVLATFNNLSEGTDIKNVNVDMSVATWTLIKSNSTDPQLGDKLKNGLTMTQEYNKNKKKQELTYKLSSNAIIGQTFNAVYDISDITVDGIKAEPVRITFKGIITQPTLKISKSGTINTIDYSTNIKCKLNFKGLTEPDIGNLVVLDGTESDETTGSKIFRAEQDPEKPEIVYIYAKHADPAVAANEMINKVYNMVLRCEIQKNDPNKRVDSQLIKVKPIQKVPNLIMNRKRAVFYAGVKDGNRTFAIDLTKTGQLKTHITGVKIKDSNSEDLQNAFVIKQYTDGDIYYNGAADPISKCYDWMTKRIKKVKAGQVIIECTAPELLVSGKTYSLVLETEFDGQFNLYDRNGNQVYEKYRDGRYKKDQHGERIKSKVTGSTITVPVVVYK